MKKKINILLIISLICIIFSAFADSFGNIDAFNWVKTFTNSVGYGILAFVIGKFIKEEINEENKNKYIFNTFKIYIIFQLLYMLVSKKLFVADIMTNIVDPIGLNIVLMSFILYIFILPMLDKSSNPILISFMLAIIGGVSTHDFIFGIDKMLCILPYAMIGYKKGEEFLEELMSSKKKIIESILYLVPILGIMVTLIVLGKNILPFASLSSAKNLYAYDIYLVVFRIIMYIYSIFTIAFIHKFADLKLFKKIKKNLDKSFVYYALSFEIILIYLSKLNEEYIPRAKYVPICMLLTMIASYVIYKLPKIKFKGFREKKKVKEEKTKILKVEKKTLKGVMEYIFTSRIILIILVPILVLKSFFFCVSTYKIDFKSMDYILMSISVVSILVSPLIFIKKSKNRLLAIILLDLLISMMLFADNIYFGYSSNIMSLSQITNAKYGKEITAALPNIIKPIHFLYFVDLVVLLPIFMKTKNKGQVVFSKVTTVAIFFTVVAVNANLAISRITNASTILYDKNIHVIVGTIFGYHINDVVQTFNQKAKIVYDKPEEVKADLEKINSNKNQVINKKDVEGIAKGKNVIIVQLESVQNFIINRKINGQEISPNLNKFVNENINISNMHQQSYSSTADSEFAFTTGLFPLENGQSFEKYYASKYPDIYSILKAEGYHTAYVHGNRGNFWNREAVYKAFKVDDTKYIESLDSSPENLVFGWISDESLYSQMVPNIMQNKEPYIQTIVAASSHNPFTLEGLSEEERKEKANLNLGKYENTYFGNYIEACKYADYSFGVLIEKLKEQGIYEDTVLFVFGDHNGLKKDDEDLLTYMEEETGKKLTKPEIDMLYTNVMAGMKVPGVESCEISYPTSKIDVKSTILDLLGVEDILSLGKTVFADREYASLNNGIIYTSKYVYNSKWYDIKTGKELDLESIPKEEQDELNSYIDKVKIKINISNAIGIKDMLAEIK